MLVAQILKGKGTEGVFTIPSNITVSDAIQVLSDKKIGAVIVSDDGSSPMGILSERDIVKALGQRGQSSLDLSVTDLMTPKLVSCTASETADQVLEKMSVGRFRHMPVMDGAAMIGLISIGDVVKARLSELAMEKDALEGMIKGF